MYKRFEKQWVQKPTMFWWTMSEPRSLTAAVPPHKIFVCSTFELFHPATKEIAWGPNLSMRDLVFDVIEKNPQHTFQILTKLPENIDRPMPHNVWLGLTLEGSRDIYKYLAFDKAAARVKFVSYEPLLSRPLFVLGIDWFIFGRLTGHGRKHDPPREWIQAVVDVARKHGIPIFLKDNLREIWGPDLIQEFPDDRYFMIYPHLDRDGMIAFDDLEDLRVEILTYFFTWDVKQIAEDLNALADVGLVHVFPFKEKIAIKFIRFRDFQTFAYDKEGATKITMIPEDSGALRITLEDSGALRILPPKFKSKFKSKEEKERNAREAHASPLPSLSLFEQEILRTLQAVPGFPRDPGETIKYIRELKIEFPRVDILEEIKKKTAWWKDNPLGKKSNPHLQLRNWMRKAQEWAQEAAQDRQVGQTPRAELEKDPIPDALWQAVAHTIGKAGGDVPDFLYQKSQVFELDENIEAWERIKAKSPEALIGFIKGKFEELPKKRGTTKCPGCGSIVLNQGTCQNCGEALG
jgi:protein gp37